MAVEVEHEDMEKLKKWGMGLESIQERCEFCGIATRYWHARTNTPCCQVCAAKKEESDFN